MLWEETHTLTHTHKRSKVEGVKGEGRADTDRHRQVGAEQLGGCWASVHGCMPSQAVGAGEGGRGIATRAIKGKSSAGRVQGTSCYRRRWTAARHCAHSRATLQFMALDASSTSSSSRAGAALRGETRVGAVVTR